MLNTTIKYNNDIKERFIPIDYEELLTQCLSYLKQDTEQYKIFSRLLSLYYQSLFHDERDELKKLYRPFSPDKEMLSLTTFTSEEYKDKQDKLFSKLDKILNNSNYNILSEDALKKTMDKTSLYSVNVEIDFDDYEAVQLYTRGESIKVESVRDPWKLYLVKKEVKTLIYRRLCVILKLKHIDVRTQEVCAVDGKDFDSIKCKLSKNNPLLVYGDENQHIFIKLFKNVPRTDLKMLFPNSKASISLLDRLKLGVFGGGGAIWGLIGLVGKLTVAVAIFSQAVLIALVVFVGLIWRQVKEVISHQTSYTAKLLKTLYSYSIGDNEAVLTYLTYMAEESESKEVLLSYLFLVGLEKPITKMTLDKNIEEFIKVTYNIEMDFEIEDALRKLHDLDMVKEKDGYLYAVKVSEAVSLLESRLHSIIKV